MCTQRASISNPLSRLTLFIAREENSTENCINSGSSQLSISVEAFLGPDPSPRLTWKSPSILITEPCSLCTGVRWITRRNCNIASSRTREGRALIIAIRQETSCPGPFMFEEDQMLGNKSQPLSQVAHSATTVLSVRCRISLARTILESNIFFGLAQFGQLQAFQSRLNEDQKYPRILDCIHDMQLVNHLGIIIRRSKSFACFIKSCISICNVGVNLYRYDLRVSNLACTKFPL